MSALYAARKCLMKEDKGFQNIELRKTDLQKIMYGIKQKTRSAANRHVIPQVIPLRRIYPKYWSFFSYSYP